MYKFDDVKRFSRGPKELSKNCIFPVKNQRKFISAKCIGAIYCKFEKTGKEKAGSKRITIRFFSLFLKKLFQEKSFF